MGFFSFFFEKGLVGCENMLSLQSVYKKAGKV